MASSSRKVRMSKWKEGQRRRSVACEPQQWRPVDPTPTQAMALQQKITPGAGSGKTRPFQHVAAPFSYQADDVQRSNQQGHDDHPISSEWMPEKRILEHILDILQRRDTYEIFAEPVDPEEVEDYYEIIKEPMDFGTMRAKLHEGMYTSLEQFEHDVYLIPQNAMHFNSPTTVYFRQARSIYELATKVLSCLKTDPEKFEFEFSDTKRRTSRRLMCEVRAPSTNLRSSIKTNLSSSNLGKSVRGICQHSGCATGFDTKHSSATNCRRKSYGEVDRRCTYTPRTSENASTDSKPLIPVKQQNIGYRESLMLFVKDLGPTAQMVAGRKLADASECLTTESVNIFGHLHSHKVDEEAVDNMLDLRWRKAFTFDLPFLKKRLHHINSSG